MINNIINDFYVLLPITRISDKDESQLDRVSPDISNSILFDFAQLLPQRFTRVSSHVRHVEILVHVIFFHLVKIFNKNAGRR